MRENYSFNFRTFTSFFLIIFSFAYHTNAQTASKVYSKFNINRISTYIYNDGIADVQLNSNSGFEFPKGSNLHTNHYGGFIWGGKVNGKITAGGSSYRSGLRPGKILPNGKADDPNSDMARVFRVRRDYRTADLSMEAKDENKSVSDIYIQYEKDWKQWPASDGAPFVDLNKDGVYQPGIDIPGIIGADQTLWFVANDLDSIQTKYFTGSLPIGIEMQVTVWGYKYDGTYRGDALFKKYVLINKSKNEIKEMCFGIWADPDVGDASDDLAGCDTTLNMVYTFGGKDNDLQYGKYSPAFGYSLLQGPVVDGLPNDKAIFKNRIIGGKKNLKMSAFGWIFKHLDWGDPQLGTDKTAEQLYNFLNGKSKSGLDWQIPQRLGGGITRFPFSGDYVNKTGYFDGVENALSDKRMMLCIGPFNVAAGDTQEVVFMESAAGAVKSKSHLDAIVQLKKDAASAINNYSHEFKYYTNPAKIDLDIINLDSQVILDWGENIERIKQIENEYYEYSFQGYNVYQFADSAYDKASAKLLLSCDKADNINKISPVKYDNLLEKFENNTVFYTNNSGVKRFFIMSFDSITKKPLINWSQIYLGVTYFSTRKEGNNYYYIESDVFRCKALPNSASKGGNQNSLAGSFINAAQVYGNSNEYVFSAQIINPFKLGNYDYQVSFNKIGTDFNFTLVNLTTGKLVFENYPLFFQGDIPHFNGLRFGYTKKGYIPVFPLKETDVFRFSAKSIIYETQLEINQFANINVFPNPFYGLNKMDTRSSDKFVTFTHLPQEAVIRIFNLSGQLVRVLEKNSAAKTITWNLCNNDGWLIPGGFYIAQIELPDYGKIKTLKMIIIPSSTINP
ncbi:MAG: hypothetical protein FD143_1359 [Ignavibacteria bacterium]|nr:MAG: hypothetical protein FD143_1359 [Ignavibacteria bacterium]KAF0160665.1 MAG: hypothetical protein FD188_1572 [Ignavibacteria bacterium]